MLFRSGMATLIGSPPNAIAAAAAGLTFRDWLSWGIPFFLILFPIMVALLYFLLRPTFEQQLVLNHTPLNINRQHIGVIIIFACTALGWVSSSHLSELLGINRGLDAVIAVLAIVFLVGSGSLKFEEFTAKTNWGILILFGGGLTLSALLQSTGASAWLAELISSHLPDNNHWLVLIIICLFVIFLTELVSNTASAALLIPLFSSLCFLCIHAASGHASQCIGIFYRPYHSEKNDAHGSSIKLMLSTSDREYCVGCN
mgnify:CR=1 FL=1